MLPDAGVRPQVGGDALHVEAVLVYQLNGLLLIVTRVYVPYTCQVLQDRLCGWPIFVIFFSFFGSLKFSMRKDLISMFFSYPY